MYACICRDQTKTRKAFTDGENWVKHSEKKVRPKALTDDATENDVVILQEPFDSVTRVTEAIRIAVFRAFCTLNQTRQNETKHNNCSLRRT